MCHYETDKTHLGVCLLLAIWSSRLVSFLNKMFTLTEVKHCRCACRVKIISTAWLASTCYSGIQLPVSFKEHLAFTIFSLPLLLSPSHFGKSLDEAHSHFALFYSCEACCDGVVSGYLLSLQQEGEILQSWTQCCFLCLSQGPLDKHTQELPEIQTSPLLVHNMAAVFSLI